MKMFSSSNSGQIIAAFVDPRLHGVFSCRRCCLLIQEQEEARAGEDGASHQAEYRAGPRQNADSGAICNHREEPSCCPGRSLELSCQLGSSPLTIDGATARLGHSCDCVAEEPRLAAYVQEAEARPQGTRSAGKCSFDPELLKQKYLHIDLGRSRPSRLPV